MTGEHLRKYLDLMQETTDEYGFQTRRLEPWFVGMNGLPDHDFNREIAAPGEWPECPEGAVAIRVDDDFWMVALLPYEFRNLSIETLVSVLWPEIEKPEFRPDSGSDEQKAYYRERQRKLAAYRLASEERDGDGTRFRPSYETARQIEGTIYEIEVLNPTTLEKEIRRVDVEEYFARRRGKTIRFKK